MGSDASLYAFALPDAGGPITATVELRFRRVFQDVMDARGWGTPEIVMEQAFVTLDVRPWWEVYLPLVMRET
jgi:hypothetical protein